MTVRALEGRTLAVIGGSSEIGREVARQAASLGAELLITGRDQVKLAAAADGARQRARAVVLDAHDDRALEAFVETLDGVDHVVSMIGDSMSGGFLDTPPSTMRHVWKSKFWANWTIARLVAPKVHNQGTITFTAGTGGRPHQISASYVANLGIEALVHGLAVELAPRVRVNEVTRDALSVVNPQYRRRSPRADVPGRDAADAGAPRYDRGRDEVERHVGLLGPAALA
jgi:NAD(P)-dependent dehydrogenase (short-subunit alcohol dehydrogenase family)